MKKKNHSERQNNFGDKIKGEILPVFKTHCKVTIIKQTYKQNKTKQTTKTEKQINRTE